MSPEAVPHLDRARRFLGQARGNVADEAWETVAFNAYTAAFHAAQVLVFERSRLTPKTHNGLKSELHRLARIDPAMGAALVARFSTAETVRNDAVYAYVEMSEERAMQTLAWAEAFIVDVERVIG